MVADTTDFAGRYPQTALVAETPDLADRYRRLRWSVISCLRTSHRAALMALISLASVQTYAQVFKAGTELVSIPPMATGGDGASGSDGLRAEDFRVVVIPP